MYALIVLYVMNVVLERHSTSMLPIGFNDLLLTCTDPITVPAVNSIMLPRL